jgi:hypothetical protein
MRSALVDTYYETLDYCFDSVLGDMLGSTVRDSVYNLLERNGIQRRDFGTRFDSVVEVLTRSLGSCCRVVVHRTVTEMYRQYSQRLDFNYDDSLREKLNMLKESTIANHLVPRRHYETSTFDSLYQQVKGNDGSTQFGSQTSFYPLKKGVKT